MHGGLHELGAERNTPAFFQVREPGPQVGYFSATVTTCPLTAVPLGGPTGISNCIRRCTSLISFASVTPSSPVPISSGSAFDFGRL